MKTLIFALTLSLSTIAFAGELAPRHVNMIEKAITSQCGFMYDLKLISTQEEILMNDNGNRVIGYVSTFSGFQPYDQNMVDRYSITVASTYADGYDHDARDWGLYSVDSVKCVQE